VCGSRACARRERLLVADTSALLDRPLLQDWRPDDECWTIIALPQVLSELAVALGRRE